MAQTEKLTNDQFGNILIYISLLKLEQIINFRACIHMQIQTISSFHHDILNQLPKMHKALSFIIYLKHYAIIFEC